MKNVVYLILVSLLVFTSCKKDSNLTTPTEDSSTVTYSGKVYHTVKIGNQTWLKENLDVGVMIQDTTCASNNGVIEKYCYGNDTANCTKYGGLYQWDEAMCYVRSERAQGICPAGWHIPTKAEFDKLSRAVDYNSNSLIAVGHGTGSGIGTDSSGFSALLAGCCYGISGFYGFGIATDFWSSTEYSVANVYDVNLSGVASRIYIDHYNTENGFSVRCIKDE